MNEIIGTKEIESKIYNIRGVEVMFDSDLAEIYKCSNGTKTINLAVKRNTDRLPKDFYFQLNEEEFSQICGFNLKPQKSKIRSLPFVFTEQGVAMLATVIRTKIESQVSINIMRAFVHMRHYIRYNERILPHKYLLLEDKVDNNSKRIDELFEKFDSKVIAKDSIFFKGDIYDAYSVLLEIFDLSKDEIIIIDNYVGKKLLDELRAIDRKIIIISSNINDILKDKYSKQYDNITFLNNDSYHDRFIIVDRKRVFHCGASFKDLGKKCFGIHEIENKTEIEKILENVLNVMIKS